MMRDEFKNNGTLDMDYEPNETNRSRSISVGSSTSSATSPILRPVNISCNDMYSTSLEKGNVFS